MPSTADRLREHLADPSKIASSRALYDDVTRCVIRSPFVTADGIEVSIQQSGAHYCSLTEDTFELGYVPHSNLLGDEPEDVYGHVPFDTVVAYIDEIEARQRT